MRVERIRTRPKLASPYGAGGGDRGLPVADRQRLTSAEKSICNNASTARAVMLHLRDCYVSKAAILTVSAPRVPVENRSPA